MATKSMPAFEKSKADKDTKAVAKKYGPEGSKKEEAYDARQMAAKRGKATAPAPMVASAIPGGPAATGGSMAFRNGGKVGARKR